MQTPIPVIVAPTNWLRLKEMTDRASCSLQVTLVVVPLEVGARHK